MPTLFGRSQVRLFLLKGLDRGPRVMDSGCRAGGRGAGPQRGRDCIGRVRPGQSRRSSVRHCAGRWWPGRGCRLRTRTASAAELGRALTACLTMIWLIGTRRASANSILASGHPWPCRALGPARSRCSGSAGRHVPPAIRHRSVVRRPHAPPVFGLLSCWSEKGGMPDHGRYSDQGDYTSIAGPPCSGEPDKADVQAAASRGQALACRTSMQFHVFRNL